MTSNFNVDLNNNTSFMNKLSVGYNNNDSCNNNNHNNDSETVCEGTQLSESSGSVGPSLKDLFCNLFNKHPELQDHPLWRKHLADPESLAFLDTFELKHTGISKHQLELNGVISSIGSVPLDLSMAQERLVYDNTKKKNSCKNKWRDGKGNDQLGTLEDGSISTSDTTMAQGEVLSKGICCLDRELILGKTRMESSRNHDNLQRDRLNVFYKKDLDLKWDECVDSSDSESMDDMTQLEALRDEEEVGNGSGMIDGTETSKFTMGDFSLEMCPGATVSSIFLDSLLMSPLSTQS